MFPRLRKKLVLVYTLSTGLILSCVLAIAFFFYASSAYRQQEAVFQNYLFTLSSRLQSDSVFSDSELAQLELKNHLVISIEENGHPLFFSGAYEPRTRRDALTERTEKAAQTDGISTTSGPISSEVIRSSVYQIRGDHGDSYLASVLVARMDSGYKKLTLLADETGFRTGLIRAGLLYALIDAAGIALLFLIGRRFVRHAMEPAEKSYKKQQEFVAAASHELRSPLAVIRTSAAAVLDSPEHSPRLVDTIISECRRGGRLVRSLLLLASADDQSLHINHTRFELDELLLDLLELYEPLCRSRGANLLLELPGEHLPSVCADQDMCRQILTILLDNAIAHGLPGDHSGTDKETAPHTRDREKIVIKAEYDQKHVNVSVIDHGPGLTAAEKGLVFDRFYRKDKSRNSKEHFGLGLSIAASLAGVQKLKPSAEDTKGGGCTFRLEF